MEGYNAAAGCGAGCRGCTTWVPFPRTVTRRDALLDAVGRTDNPCDRPSRCNPCCRPLPKYRRPMELPICDLNCYKEEQKEAKIRDCCEKQAEFEKNCCPPPCCDGMRVESLRPCDHPICVDAKEELPPEKQLIVQEVSCRTNIIAGFFNPDDNKTSEQKLKEQCDTTYLSCGPNLPMYPCRGVIQYPPLAWTTVAKEMDKCGKIVCQGTKYCDPEFQKQLMEEKKKKDEQKRLEAERKQLEEEYKNNFYNPKTIDPCCANQQLSLSPYCNCGVDKSLRY